MGCSSSRQVEESTTPAQPQTRTRTRSTPAITSTTAINTSSASQLQRPSQLESHSNISTPRTSSQPLTEHYNVPLVAPKPWSSTNRTWTRSQLTQERRDFFDSRVSGQPEIWIALKTVTDLLRQGELHEAQGILDAAEITLPTGRLEQGGYDERGMLYKLPECIVSDPVNVVDDDQTVVGLELAKQITVDQEDIVEEKIDKGKEAIEKDAVKVRCRLSDRGGPDTIVLIGETQPVSVLIRRLRSEAALPAVVRVRMAYFGRILDEKQTLEEQGWQSGHIVQAMVSSFGS